MSSLLEIATSNPHYRESVVAVVLTCAIIVLLNGLYQYASQGNRREYVYASVPPGWYGYRIGQARYLTQCAAMIQEGIQKVCIRPRALLARICADLDTQFGESGVYWIPTMMGPTMVAPRRYLAELKNHPNLSFADYLHEAFGGAHTNFEAPLRSQNFMAVVKRHITRSLGHVVGILTEEAALALEDDLPPSDGEEPSQRPQCRRIRPAHILSEWTPYKPHPTTMRIVSRISSRLFVGEALCRQKRWLDITLNFSSQINTAGVGLRMAGKRMAPIVKWWIPSYRLFKKTLREADAILMGVVKERRELEKAQGAAYVKPDDALQWALDLGEPDSELANFQLFLSNVAIQTTSAALTHMVYDLCMYPEYVEILREELREVLGDGNFSAKAEVQKLVKMDSFMKESQRLHPLQNSTHAPFRARPDKNSPANTA